MDEMAGSTMSAQDKVIVWFRGKDLRLTDHGPLMSALEAEQVWLVFVLDPFFFTPARAQELPHRMQFLLDGLQALEKNIAAKGSQLLVLAGHSLNVLPRLVHKLGATRVVAHRWTEPVGRRRDALLQARLDVPFELFEGETLLPPDAVRSGSGHPYSVYTPFARAARALLALPSPFRAPSHLPPPTALPPASWVSAIPRLEELGIERNPRIQRGGEAIARKRLQSFLDERLSNYAHSRDRMDEDGTSRLSADLKFGTLSVRSIWHALSRLPASEGRHRFEAELLWREFAYHNLWHRPELLERPFRSDFADFPYRTDATLLEAWQRGQTGYPVVDATARQLLLEGYVHNRARMVSASFLTKHLLIDYRKGESHYLKYLTDGDWAANNLGWQWSAGSGVDAAPYFRVFNPTTQGEKFDPEGDYVRKYVPEIAMLPTRYIHTPWTAPDSVLRSCNIRLGHTYPLPIVDHKQAREAFLRVAGEAIRATKDKA